MPRVPVGRRAMTVALSSLLLVAALFVPLAGSAGASTPSTTCLTTTSEGGSPFNTCWLDIAAPSSVRTGVAFTVQVRVTTDATKTTVATSDPCGSKALITLYLSGPYNQTLQANASAGIATFSFTIPAGPNYAGTYFLNAYGPGGDAAPATAASADLRDQPTNSG